MEEPIMVGQTILEKSKELMYQFYYDYLLPKYNHNIKVLYSFILEIHTNDFYEDIKGDLEQWFDTCGYHKKTVLPNEYAKISNVNKKRLV